MALDKIRMSMLYDVYGALISEKQREAVEMYINEDYSLSEVAENIGISRQGVREQIKHAEGFLENCEEKLKLLERFRNISGDLDKLEAQKDEKTEKLLEDIRKNIIFE